MKWSCLQKRVSKFTAKKFYEIYPCSQYYKTFWGVIYNASGTFPYYFDWGYTDSNVIVSKKVLLHWPLTFIIATEIWQNVQNWKLKSFVSSISRHSAFGIRHSALSCRRKDYLLPTLLNTKWPHRLQRQGKDTFWPRSIHPKQHFPALSSLMSVDKTRSLS